MNVSLTNCESLHSSYIYDLNFDSNPEPEYDSYKF